MSIDEFNKLELNRSKLDIILHHKYPITIISDRYDGTYSNGTFTCWPLYHYQIPDGVDSSDIGCSNFWNSIDKSKVGIGNTPNEALNDLLNKLKILYSKYYA